jgi:hypothetical protein
MNLNEVLVLPIQLTDPKVSRRYFDHNYMIQHSRRLSSSLFQKILLPYHPEPTLTAAGA